MLADWQWIVNAGAGTILMVTGWFCRQLWDSVQNLKADLNQLEVRLPAIYVSKVDFAGQMQRLEQDTNAKFARIMAQLDRIYDKIEGKADK